MRCTTARDKNIIVDITYEMITTKITMQLIVDVHMFSTDGRRTIRNISYVGPKETQSITIYSSNLRYILSL